MTDTGLTIQTFSIEVPANRRNGDYFPMYASVKLDDAIVLRAIELAKAKAKDKYPNVLIAPLIRLHFSKREKETALTAVCELCLGDGDYVSRQVEIPLPEIRLYLPSEYRDD